jgi:hypothetical protein
MLVRLTYASRACEPVRPDVLAAIVRRAAVHNQSIGVTGLLCASGDVFLQVLEGGRMEVSTLYNRIARDPLHRDVILLRYEDIDERHFAGWSMGQVDLGRLNPALLLKYSDRAALDPFRMSGAAAMALLDDLIATASVTCST